MDARIQPPVRDRGMPEAIAGLKHELGRRGIDLAFPTSPPRSSG